MNNNPKVSIILVNWNGIDDTRKCLDSLKNIDYQNYQIILVDNGSKEDEATLLAQEYPYLQIIRSKKNLGFTGGNNLGIQRALEQNSGYVLLLNTDTVVKPNFLSEMIQTGESSPLIGVVGAKIYFMEMPEKLVYFGLYLNLKNSVILSDGFDTEGKQFTQIKEYDYVGGCCLLIKKETIQKAGMLDDRFFAYFEEADWCFRARELGYSVVGSPNAIIWHKDPYPPKDKRGAFQNYLVTRNRLLFTQKHLKNGFVNYLIRSSWMYLVIPVLKAIKHNRWSEVRAYILGWCDYLTKNWGMNRSF